MAARAQARAALGRDPSAVDPFDAPPKKRTPPPAEAGPVWVKLENPQYGLFLGEAAARLGISGAQLEAMIAAGKVRTVGAYTPFIPTTEVERLRLARPQGDEDARHGD